jgi:hypothetical protein
MTSTEFHEFYFPMALVAAALAVVVLLAVFAGRYAEAKGHSFALGFWLSMVAPFVAWIILSILPDKSEPKKVSAELGMQIELEKARLAVQNPAPHRRGNL